MFAFLLTGYQRRFMNQGTRTSARQLWRMKRQSQRRDHALIARGEVPSETMHLLRGKRVRGARIIWPGTTLVDPEPTPSVASGSSAESTSGIQRKKIAISSSAAKSIGMKTVYALVRLPPRGASELIGVYSTRKKAEGLLEQLRESRRRGFRVRAVVLDAIPTEGFWFDTARERALRSHGQDPLALLLDRVKDTVDQSVHDFGRANRHGPGRKSRSVGVRK